MKKRLISGLLCAAMTLSLVACGGSGSDAGSSSDGAAQETGSEEAPSEEAGGDEAPGEEAGGDAAPSGDGSGLELAYNLATEDFAVFEGLIKDFTAETGIDL